MKRFLPLVLPLLLFLLPGCEKEPVLSYVGTWEYVSSEPDLGPEAQGSWIRLNRHFEYAAFLAPDLLLYGDTEDFVVKGESVFFSARGKDYEVKVLRLKDGEMVLETDSLGDGTTTLRFHRVSTSWTHL